jgi:predicted RNA-binding Zn-ribbon protein involved in translation (DUF1610 family)
MNDHGYVSFVVVIVEPSILCGNEWSWICFVCRSHSWTKYSVHTEYLVQTWLRQMKHIHDHSLPHRIFGSTMTTTNGTYPWSCITTMNDHGYVSFVVVIVEPSILCGNEWSWICFVCRSHGWTKYYTEYLVHPWLRQTKHIHDHSLPHIILGSPMITTNETYPWSFITTQNTWFKHDYDKQNLSMIIIKDEPSILCGNKWSWICCICRSHSWTKYYVW